MQRKKWKSTGDEGKGKKQQHIDHSALHDQTKEGHNEHHALAAKLPKAFLEECS